MKKLILTLATSLIILSNTQINVQAADAKEGRIAFETCRGCHSAVNYSNVYPTFYVPKVGGQRAAYVEAALKAYKEKARPHGTMKANADNLSEKMMANIAAHVEEAVADKNPAPSDGDAARGKKLAETCVGCHTNKLEDGGSNPILAGQYGNYLLKAMLEYQTGKRNNAIMQSMLNDMSKDDMQDIAAFFASMKGLSSVK